MNDDRKMQVDAFVESVREQVNRRVGFLLCETAPDDVTALLGPGKMLRTRLAARLAVSESAAIQRVAQNTCVAVEMLHTATLCHDDVIDGGLIRRAKPTLWRKAGTPAAILLGDLLLVESIGVLSSENPERVQEFLATIREIGVAETQSELLLRGRTVDSNRCMALAERKTGALFGIAAGCVAGNDETQAALKTAGRRIGTAYQLADDLLDITGADQPSGKTLGTDEKRKKNTLAQKANATALISRRARDLIRDAFDAVGEYPKFQRAIRTYVFEDLENAWRISTLQIKPQEFAPAKDAG